MNIDQWVLTDHSGVSSLTLWAAMKGLERCDSMILDAPHDPDDFQRCFYLMTIATEEQRAAALRNVAKLSPMWAPFVQEWALLCALFIEETSNGDGRYKKLYLKIQELRETAINGGA